MKSTNLQTVKRSDLVKGLVLYYSDSNIIYGIIQTVLKRDCRIKLTDGTTENKCMSLMLGYRRLIVPDTSGFDNARSIAFEVPAGTFRRSKDNDGNVSNFCGYKSGDGKRFFVLADSYKDISEANINDVLVVNNHPAIEIFKP